MRIQFDPAFGFKTLAVKPPQKTDSRALCLLHDLRHTARKTPLVDLGAQGLEIPNGNRILAKMEMHCSAERQYLVSSRPTNGSHYYRVYPDLLEILLHQGIIPADYALLEVSSGSAGEAFADIAGRLGFEAHCVFPNEISEKRRNLTVAKGGVIHLPDPEMDGKGLPAASRKFRRMLADGELNGKKVWSPNHAQVIETAVPLAEIASEIFYLTRIDIFIAGAGNGCSLYSIGAGLKSVNSINRIVGFEPVGSPGLFALKYPGRYETEVGPLPDFSPTSKTKIAIPIPGIGGYGLDFPYLRASVPLVDEVRLIQNGEWLEIQELLRMQTGWYAGSTSAAALMIALRLAREVHDKTLLVIFYDASDRY